MGDSQDRDSWLRESPREGEENGEGAEVRRVQEAGTVERPLQEPR